MSRRSTSLLTLRRPNGSSRRARILHNARRTHGGGGGPCDTEIVQGLSRAATRPDTRPVRGNARARGRGALSQSSDPARRAVPARGSRRASRARVHTAAHRNDGPAVRLRQPSRRERHHRKRSGREGATGRLHRAHHELLPLFERRLLQEAALSIPLRTSRRSRRWMSPPAICSSCMRRSPRAR